MRSVLAHENDHDRLSVVRATAIALGLPLVVLETVEGLDSLESHDQAASASSGALVLVMRRPHGSTTSLAKARLAVARDAEVAAQVSALPAGHGVSEEGGIVRFNLGERGKEVASESVPGASEDAQPWYEIASTQFVP